MLTIFIAAVAIVAGWFAVAVAGSLLVGGAVRLRDSRRIGTRHAVVVRR